MPPGVINFVPGNPVPITNTILAHPEFAGLHFTGSTAVFRVWPSKLILLTIQRTNNYFNM
jgi:delta 1-pyrroline-5-carboxylate dehydrogenase